MMRRKVVRTKFRPARPLVATADKTRLFRSLRRTNGAPDKILSAICPARLTDWGCAASDVLAADNASSLESVRMNASLSPPAPCVKLGDVRTVADKLGVSPRTVYRLADAGRMPQPLKLGSLVRWNLSQIDDWVDAGCPDCRKGAAR
jgi:excisionase family DNA binding protein